MFRASQGRLLWVQGVLCMARQLALLAVALICDNGGQRSGKSEPGFVFSWFWYPPPKLVFLKPSGHAN